MDDMYSKRVDGPGEDSCELYKLGSAPDLPFLDLNLAGIDGIPSPQDMAVPGGDLRLNNPDYIIPCMDQPSIQFGDLAMAEVDVMPEFQVDPLQPDLTQEPAPYSMDVYSNPLIPAQPELAQDVPNDAEIAAGTDMYPWMAFQGLDTTRTYDQADPLMPELQNLDTTQDVTMLPEDRPGEMDASALDVAGEIPQQGDGDGDYDDSLPSYKQSFMSQTGDNSHRGRKMDLLLTGLKEPGSLM